MVQLKEFLEDFDPSDDMPVEPQMGVAELFEPLLEHRSSDDGHMGVTGGGGQFDPIAQGFGEGRAAGYEEGVIYAQSSWIAEQRQLLSDILSQLQNVAKCRLEAAREADARAMEFIRQFLSVAGYDLIAGGLWQQLSKQMTAHLTSTGQVDAKASDLALGRDIAALPTIFIHPDQQGWITSAFAAFERDQDWKLQADPSLQPFQARLSSEEDCVLIDLQPLRQLAEQILSASLPASHLPERLSKQTGGTEDE